MKKMIIGLASIIILNTVLTAKDFNILGITMNKSKTEISSINHIKCGKSPSASYCSLSLNKIKEDFLFSFVEIYFDNNDKIIRMEITTTVGYVDEPLSIRSATSSILNVENNKKYLVNVIEKGSKTRVSYMYNIKNKKLYSKFMKYQKNKFIKEFKIQNK